MKFKKNVGILDRILRVVFGILFLGSGLFYLNELLAYLAALIGIILIITGLTGHCSIYSILKINTIGHPICDFKIGKK